MGSKPAKRCSTHIAAASRDGRQVSQIAYCADRPTTVRGLLLVVTWKNLPMSERIRRVGVVCMFVMANSPLAACVTAEPNETQAATTAPTATDAQAISVAVRLPGTGHMDVIDGWVVDGDGNRVATFQFDASFDFLEAPSGDNNYRPPTSWTDAERIVEVELPGDGTYVFEIGEVAYWGGCGTCGRGMTGGSVEEAVTDGSVVELDLGEQAWVS